MGVNIGKVIAGLLTFFILIVEVLLSLRFVLLLTAASSDADFTLAVYDASESLVEPFYGVFPSFEAASFTLEIASLLAMLIYGLAGYLLIYLAKNFDGLILRSSGTSPHPQNIPTQMPQQPFIPQQYQQPFQGQPMYPQQGPVQQFPQQPFPQQFSGQPMYPQQGPVQQFPQQQNYPPMQGQVNQQAGHHFNSQIDSSAPIPLEEGTPIDPMTPAKGEIN